MAAGSADQPAPDGAQEERYGILALARGQERAVLAVDRVDDLLAAQLVEALFAHAGSPSFAGARSDASPASASSSWL